MKKVWILVAALAGALISSWVAPKTITWFFQSPVSTGYDCTPALDWAMNVLMISQIAGALAGAILGFMILTWAKARKNIPR